MGLELEVRGLRCVAYRLEPAQLMEAKSKLLEAPAFQDSTEGLFNPSQPRPSEESYP